MKLSFYIKAAAFTTVELLISIGLAAGLAVGFLYGFKRLSTAYQVESLKSQLTEEHQDAKEALLNDLRHAFTITGSTSNYYYPVSRLPSGTQSNVDWSSENPSSMALNAIQFANGYAAFDENDAFDGIQIYKELYPSIAGASKLVPPSGNENFFKVYYVIENKDSLTDRDEFFKQAFYHKRFFFLTNGDFRNIIENMDYLLDQETTQTQVDCPYCKDPNNCPKCYMFNGGYRDPQGDLIQPATKILAYKQSDRVSTNIRVGEKVTYRVGGACAPGVLCRTVDDDDSTAESFLKNLTEMRVSYVFKDALRTATRSLRAESYWSNLAGDTDIKKMSKAASFQEVSFLTVGFRENLDPELSKLVKDSKESAFGYDGNSYQFKSAIKIYPGFDASGSPPVEGGEALAVECSTPETARCHPGGACNYLFTGPKATKEDGSDRREDSQDYQWSPTNAFCLCGWDPVKNRFYNPAYNQKRLPYYNQLTSDNNKGQDVDEDVALDATRSNACANYFKCTTKKTAYEYKNPLCGLIRTCLTPAARAAVVSPETGITDASLTLLASKINAPTQADLQCLTQLNEWTIFSPSSAGNSCDYLYRIWKDVSPFLGPGAGHTPWADFCACRTYETSEASQPGMRGFGFNDYESLCRLPGARTQCANTWDAANKAWVLTDSNHVQGLTVEEASLCSCRRNLSGNSLDPDFAAVTSLDPNLQHGSNQIYSLDAAVSHSSNYWTMYDYQLSPTHLYYDFRIDSNGGGSHIGYNNIEFGYIQTLPVKIDSTTPPLWWACGQSKAGDQTPGPKCLSYKSQVARVKTIKNSVVSEVDVDCGKVQANLYPNLRTPGGCLASSHVERVPQGFPEDKISEGSPLWPYRFFCDKSCGVSKFESAAFYQEVLLVRKLIQEAAGFPSNAEWCASVPPAPGSSTPTSSSSSSSSSSGGSGYGGASSPSLGGGSN